MSIYTLPEYFNKDTLQKEQIDASTDVELFARKIAPRLGINVRFAGEEPKDAVTRQYNEAMSEILNRHGIDFVQIPRKEVDGQVISASTVRKLWKEKNWDELSQLVPQHVLDYLRRG